MENSWTIDEKYKVISKIKQGGFGIVYYGYDRKFDKPVAIKAIEPSLLKEAKYIDMFLEEAKNAAKLNHNNIVHVFDLIKKEDGQFYIVMEYINGVDLQQILKRCRAKDKKIPLNLGIFIIKEVCKALEYAHNKRDLITNKPLNLVHQDISPSNIMISTTGNVKLIDFGIATIKFNQNGGSGRNIILSGKLPYMAPEQLNGSKIDRRTDLFSLGTVFYETITSQKLFFEDSDEKTIEAIRKGRINNKALVDNDIPDLIQKILVKTLEKNINDRYQGANGIYIDLVEYMMNTVESVELSAELGSFVSDLFNDNGKEDNNNTEEYHSALNSESTAPGIMEDENFEIESEYSEIESEHSENESEYSEIESEHSNEELENHPEIENTHYEIDEKHDHIEDLETVDIEESNDISHNISNVSTKEKIENSAASQIENTISEPKIEEPEGIIEINSNDDSASTEVNWNNNTDHSEEENIEELNVEEIDSENFNNSEYFETSDLDNQIEEEIDNISKQDEIAQLEAELRETVQTDDNFIDQPNNLHVTEKESSGSDKDIGKFSPVMATAIADDEEGEDDIKTVIDVIRLSAKTYKKPLIWSIVGIISSFLIFMVLNVMFGWTSTGRNIYDRLFPPAIRIYSAPQGATVYIDDQKLTGTTPLSVPKISPGVHKLSLEYAGYPMLTRSLQVPSKGELQIDGEKSRKGYEPYVFRFKTLFELNSNPPGATIYINNIKYNQKTPTELEWEVGVPLKVEMSRPGFQDLTGFTFNTLDESVEISDHRLWNFSSVDDENKKYKIEGLFKRFVKMTSIPTNATFYLDGTTTPTGKTGSDQAIALSVGKHTLLFKHAGFHSKSITVTVDEQGPKSIFTMLNRTVRVFSKDKNDPTENDIGAQIKRIYRQGKSYRRNIQTPCDLSLPPVTHKLLIQKQGFKDAVVSVSPNQKVLVVRMQPDKINIEVVVTDALSGLALNNTQVSVIDLEQGSNFEEHFGITDENGRCSKALTPGKYTVKVHKNRYFDKSMNLDTLEGENKLVFKLIIQ